MVHYPRFKFKNPEEGFYHIVTRTVIHKQYILAESEKEYFLTLLKKMARVYFVKLVSFQIMSNHVHIICQMIPEKKINDKELKERFHLYYNEGKPKKKHRTLFQNDHEYYRERFGDVSKFMQDVKQRFSRWYNKKHDNKGHVWAERFKSVLLDSERALLSCMVYVELNAVRAGIVSRPEEYRYGGLSHFVTGGFASEWLDFNTLHRLMSRPDSDEKSIQKDVLTRYMQLIYEEGMIKRPNKASIDSETGDRTIENNFEGAHLLSFRRRIRYFTDGLILGSKEFCESKFREFSFGFKAKKERSATVLKARYKKGHVSVPKDHLLHIHSIRTYSLE